MPHRRERLSERISLAIAIAIHVAAFIVARRRVVCVESRPAEPSEIAIEVEDVATAPTVSPGPSPATGEGRRARVAPPLPLREKAPGGEGSLASLVTPPPSVPPVEAPPRPAQPISLAQLGIEGPNRFIATPSESTWTIHDAEDGVRRSIADSLLKHDRSVGLGSEGPALAAIEELVVASTAAVNGRAVLSLVADAAGAVRSVSCVDGDRAQWDGIAAAIARALETKRLRAAPGGRGVEMRIEVTSREQMPSGRDPGVEVRAFHIPIKKGRGPKSTRVDILDVDPKIVVDQDPEDPAAPQASPVKFPKAHIQIVKLFGIDFDPADIGANARRVVHAKVIEEHPL